MAKKIGSAYTEDWLPVESIQNGMIVCSDKNKVTGVKIAPRNIFILDAQAQDNVLISLKNFYNMIDFEFWLVVADRPVDISVYMSQLQLLYNDTYHDNPWAPMEPGQTPPGGHGPGGGPGPGGPRP